MFGALPFIFLLGELGESRGIVKGWARVGVFGFFGWGRFLSTLAIRSRSRRIGLFVNNWENMRNAPDAHTARAICQQCATRSGTTAMVFLMCALAALGGGVRGCVYVCTQTTHD